MWPFQTRMVVPDELNAIRAERERVLAQSEEIKQRRCDRATADQRCAAALARAEAHGAQLDVTRFARANYDPRSMTTALLRFSRRDLFAQSPEAALEAVTISLWPAMFAERVRDALDALYADDDKGLTDAARA